MTCHNCKTDMVKAGKGRNEVQRYKCQQCGKRYAEPQEKPFGENVRLKQAVVIPFCIASWKAIACAPRRA